MSIINDIKAIGNLGELFTRGFTMISMKTGIYKIKFPSQYLSDEEILKGFGYEDINRLVEYIKSRSSTFLFDSKECRNEFSSIFSESYIFSIVENADRICAHRFKVFEKEVRFGRKIDWHWSEIGESWPLVHWSKMDIDFEANGGRGDFKYTWELNKHQHFPTLGRAFLVTGKDKYLKEFNSEIESWIRQNPPEIGINWVSNQELAYRSISWIIALNFFASELDDRTIINIVRVLLKHAQHIYNDINYTKRCIRNNHIIGDAVGLSILSMFLNGYIDAPKWYRKAHAIITNSIKWIFQSDGSYSLFSPNYHRISIHFLLLHAVLARRHGFPLQPRIWKILENGIFALSQVMRNNGSLPAIGYVDDASPMQLGEDYCNDIRPLLAIASVLFRNSYFKSLSQGRTEELFWLLGAEGVEKYNALHTDGKIEDNSVQLNNGIHILKGKEFRVYVLGGPHPVNSQRHSDYLSVEIIFKGLNFVVDGGNYKYNTEEKWNHYFRSSFAHNTIIADRQSQALPYKEFRWIGRGECLLNEFSEHNNYVIFDEMHDAYRRLGIKHRRIFILFKKQEFVLIIDRITGRGKHELQQLFHLGFPDVELDKSSNICVVRKDDVGLQVVPISGIGLSSDIVKGQTNPIQGWISCCYGNKMPSPTLVYKQKSALPAYFITAFMPINWDISYNILAHNEDILAFDISKGTSSYLVVYIFKQGRVFNYNGRIITKSSVISLEH